MPRLQHLAPAVLLLVSSGAAGASEVWGGAYVHDIDTPLTKSGFEKGVDAQVGYRGGRIGALSFIGAPSPYILGSINTAGETNFAAAGLSWKIGDALYLRPGLGLAVHDGSAGKFQRTDRIAFGSRVLFAPEIGAGARLSDRMSVEASWVHLSHGQLFGGQNPGMDSFGVRLNYRLR